MARLAGAALARRVRFIHLNHTNRLLWDAAAGAAWSGAASAWPRDGEVDRRCEAR